MYTNKIYMTPNTNLSVIPSGFSELDRVTGGWRPGRIPI